jgi:3-hydroxyacyl-CoA dehydrogenase
MIDRIAVVGAGFMGGGIAAEFALRLGHDVRVAVWDPKPGAAEAAVERARAVAAILVQAEVVDAADAEARLHRMVAVATIEEAVDGAAYIAEAVPEHLPTKQAIFHDLDRVASPDAILASNTLTHPERVVVAHYFGPAYLIPLVEVVPHAGTAPGIAEQTAEILRAAGKRPAILGRFAPGFVANRLQQALFREALHLAREGIATPEVIDAVVRHSFGARLAALGPFTVADFAGLDVYASIATNVWPDLSNETAADGPPPELASHLDDGTVGTKAGAGVFEWSPERLAAVTARRDQILTLALRIIEGRG